MAAMRTFTIEEVEAKVGKHVRLKTGLLDAKAGEIGTVTDYKIYDVGYVLRVMWEKRNHLGIPRYDWFEPGGFTEYLEEL